MVILKSRGQGPKKMEKYGTNLSLTLNKNLDLVPWIGEYPLNQKLIWYFPTILTYMIALENCQNNISNMVVLRSRGQHFILVNI